MLVSRLCSDFCGHCCHFNQKFWVQTYSYVKTLIRWALADYFHSGFYNINAICKNSFPLDQVFNTDKYCVVKFPGWSFKGHISTTCRDWTVSQNTSCSLDLNWHTLRIYTNLLNFKNSSCYWIDRNPQRITAVLTGGIHKHRYWFKSFDFLLVCEQLSHVARHFRFRFVRYPVCFDDTAP